MYLLFRTVNEGKSPWIWPVILSHLRLRVPATVSFPDDDTSELGAFTPYMVLLILTIRDVFNRRIHTRL